MTKIDPITGCEVMTISEFFLKEAEIEGKDPADIWNEVFAELEEDSKKCEEEMTANAFQFFWRLLKEERKNWQEEQVWLKRSPFHHSCMVKPPMIKRLVQVCSTKVHQSIGPNSGKSIRAVFLCSDNVERMFCYSESSYSGSMINPPDFDSELAWYTQVEWRNNPRCCKDSFIGSHEGIRYCTSCDEEVW